MQEENHLQNFIVEMVEMFRDDEDVEIEETVITLQRFRDKLESYYDQYECECPEGSESLQIQMRNGVTLFFGALEALEDFIEEPDDELLDEALENAAQGASHLEKASALTQMIADSKL